LSQISAEIVFMKPCVS